MHIDRSILQLFRGFFAYERVTATVVCLIVLLSVLDLAIFDLKHSTAVANLYDAGASYYFIDRRYPRALYWRPFDKVRADIGATS